MKKPIAVLGTTEAYKHLCAYCHLPLRNEIFWHVPEWYRAGGIEFQAMIEIGDPSKIKDETRDFVKAMIR